MRMRLNQENQLLAHPHLPKFKLIFVSIVDFLLIFVVAIVKDKLCVFLYIAIMLISILRLLLTHKLVYFPECSQIFEVLAELNEGIDLELHDEEDEDEDFKFSAYELDSDISSSSDE